MAETLLVVESLDKVYGEGVAATHALRGVSFELARGEFASIEVLVAQGSITATRTPKGRTS